MLVLATSVPVIKASKKKKVALAQILYIYYLFRFRKNDKNKIWALINFGSKGNAITPAYILKLGLQIRQTDVRAQKIDSSTFEMFEMVLANF